MKKSSHEIWGERYVPAWGPKDGFGIREGEDVLGLDEEERELWEHAYTDPQRAEITKQRDARRLEEHQEVEKQEWSANREGVPHRQYYKKPYPAIFANYPVLNSDERNQEKYNLF